MQSASKVLIDFIFSCHIFFTKNKFFSISFESKFGYFFFFREIILQSIDFFTIFQHYFSRNIEKFPAARRATATSTTWSKGEISPRGQPPPSPAQQFDPQIVYNESSFRLAKVVSSRLKQELGDLKDLCANDIKNKVFFLVFSLFCFDFSEHFSCEIFLS